MAVSELKWEGSEQFCNPNGGLKLFSHLFRLQKIFNVRFQCMSYRNTFVQLKDLFFKVKCILFQCRTHIGWANFIHMCSETTFILKLYFIDNDKTFKIIGI